jgi:hypothetical protein
MIASLRYLIPVAKAHTAWPFAGRMRDVDWLDERLTSR